MKKLLMFIFLFGLATSLCGMKRVSSFQSSLAPAAKKPSSPISYDAWLACLEMPVPCRKGVVLVQEPSPVPCKKVYAEEICHALKLAYEHEFADAEFYRFFSPLITSWLLDNRYHYDLMNWFEYEVADGVCMFIQQTESLGEYCRNNCDKEVARYRKNLWATFGRNVLNLHVSMSATVYAQHVAEIKKDIDAYKQSLYALDPVEAFKQSIIKKINNFGHSVYQEMLDELTK